MLPRDYPELLCSTRLFWFWTFNRNPVDSFRYSNGRNLSSAIMRVSLMWDKKFRIQGPGRILILKFVTNKPCEFEPVICPLWTWLSWSAEWEVGLDLPQNSFNSNLLRSQSYTIHSGLILGFQRHLLILSDTTKQSQLI